MQGEHILSGNNGIMRRYVLSTKNCLWIKCAAHDDDGDDDDVLLCNFIWSISLTVLKVFPREEDFVQEKNARTVDIESSFCLKVLSQLIFCSFSHSFVLISGDCKISSPESSLTWRSKDTIWTKRTALRPKNEVKNFRRTQVSRKFLLTNLQYLPNDC